MSTLAEIGVHVPGQPGEHRAPCPRCEKGRRDDALAVKVEPDGACTWVCHRCGWRGGIGPDRKYRRSVRRPPPRPEPERGQQPFTAVDMRRWAKARQILPGTVAADYLGIRGCALPHPEGDLRWHAKVRNWTCGHVGPA